MSEAVTLAKAAREHLAGALKALQSDTKIPDDLMDVAEPIAEAMSVLHRIQRTNGESLEGRDLVLANVRAAMAKVQAVSDDHPAVDQVLEAVAASLSKVHALARYTPPAAGSLQPVVVAPRPSSPHPRRSPSWSHRARRRRARAAARRVAPVACSPTLRRSRWCAGERCRSTSRSRQQACAVLSAAAPSPRPQEPWGYTTEPLAASAIPPTQPLGNPSTTTQPASTRLRGAARLLQPHVQPAPAQHPRYAQPAPAQQPYAPGAPASAACAPGAARPRAGARAAVGGGRELRAACGAQLPLIDVEMGIHSASNFYKGLGGNDVIEHGGIFAATYKIPKIGTAVNLRVLLPGDYEFTATAVVQWTREGRGGDTDPGFGARFTQITPEGRQLVYRYTRNREPMFYDDL
jgi:hypothetical protein